MIKRTIVGGLAFLIFFALIFGVITLGVFRLKTLDIQGNEYVSDEIIKKEIGLENARESSVLLLLGNKVNGINDDGILEEASFSLLSPGCVRVKVKEKSPTVCLGGDEYVYISDTGKVIFTREEKLEDVPVISGIEIINAIDGDDVMISDTTALKDMIDIALAAKKSNIKLEEIAAEDEGSYSARSGSLKLMLGESGNIDEKLSDLNTVATELKGQRGTLHLEYYDSSRKDIVFTREVAEGSRGSSGISLDEDQGDHAGEEYEETGERESLVIEDAQQDVNEQFSGSSTQDEDRSSSAYESDSPDTYYSGEEEYSEDNYYQDVSKYDEGDENNYDYSDQVYDEQ